MNLAHYYRITEAAIEELGVNPQDTKGEKAGQWNLQYGDYPIWVDVYEKENNIYFQVVSPILKIENHPNRNKLIETALEINDGLVLASISLHQETLWMRSILPSEFISKETVLLTLRSLGNSALRYGEFLKTNL